MSVTVMDHQLVSDFCFRKRCAMNFKTCCTPHCLAIKLVSWFQAFSQEARFLAARLLHMKPDIPTGIYGMSAWHCQKAHRVNSSLHWCPARSWKFVNSGKSCVHWGGKPLTCFGLVTWFREIVRCTPKTSVSRGSLMWKWAWDHTTCTFRQIVQTGT